MMDRRVSRLVQNSFQLGSHEENSQLREPQSPENVDLQETIKGRHAFGEMVGVSRDFKQALALGEAVAPTGVSVLILGETGTGKELFARYIHELSPRRHKPFVIVNCASLLSELVENEVFGHKRGAFTGAEQCWQGKFELADGGTLFLDEIGEMPLQAQANLLFLLQDGIVNRVGSSQSGWVDVRIIAATNKDLTKAKAKGRFRSDLYHRLYVFPITTPPLRHRRKDIPLLARFFMKKYSIQFSRQCEDIDPESLEQLVQHSWPGNSRELENVIECAMILSQTPLLNIDGTSLNIFH
ncbi:sigma-54 interaction domain-containing protein [Candidatus Nitrospira allomarina]|jgi:formate hydrogenlyase transcriptional activator|uniref:Sigma 54-interacting transcriptional regulator n=1 Tax=Candidatus Nitrospira allomarina TaxID=3020900 RepID=A0AA96G869_9BACT|nr:sigma 54-interacting transcriptional regulator [Candidatus Nitrospira allomarina]WNM56948.1 sigma 54-interacting transcriptional regulator [Candidatus Nitrospira allomarina]